MRNTEKGSAMIIIFIGILLFAALSYAVVNSMRGPVSFDREQVALQVDEMIHYADDLKFAVQRLRSSNGCTASTLNFYSPQFTNPADYANASAPGDKSCDVFDAAGGGVAWQKPPAVSLSTGGTEYFITGLWDIGGLTPSNGCDITVLARVTKEACEQVNRTARITGATPVNGWASVDFPPPGWTTIGAGFPASCVGLGWGGGTDDALHGKTLGCYQSQTDNNYYFYSILLVR